MTRCRECNQPCEGARCEGACKANHNAREKARRDARKAQHKCWVCGARAARSGGVTLTTCNAHRAYFAERGSVAPAPSEP